MYRVPVPVWQEIAAAHPEVLGNRWGRAMAGGMEAIGALDEETTRELTAQGVPNSGQVAFDMTAPLLVNNEAIQAWVRDTDNLYLGQMVLLDIECPEDAAAVADMELRLEPEEKSLLISLLEAELARSGGDATQAAESDPGTPELKFDRGHVLQGLAAMRLPRRVRPAERAILGFDGSYFTVEAFDQMFVAKATGTWPGNAHVGATLIGAMKQAPPPAIHWSSAATAAASPSAASGWLANGGR